MVPFNREHNAMRPLPPRLFDSNFGRSMKKSLFASRRSIGPNADAKAGPDRSRVKFAQRAILTEPSNL